MKRSLFVLVPSLVPTGPIKGAVALCNSLAGDFDVSLVALKPAPAFPGTLDERVRLIALGQLPGWRARVHEYRKLLERAGGRPRALSVSFCLSADVVNFLARRHAITATSLRGHLLRTYRVDFGAVGPLLAVMHFLLVSRLDRVIAMTDRMARQFAAIAGKRPVVIGNFIDEAGLEPLRCAPESTPGPWRFVFVGRLDPLKSPALVIRAIHQLTKQGTSCTLDMYGDGPLRAKLEEEVIERGLVQTIRFHGHVDNPWSQAAGAHCMVLPSLTEGVSRAALEALYLGIPCVMRDVDSNAELIRPDGNGELFRDDTSLPASMVRAARLGCELAQRRPILLGEQFRQAVCVERFQGLLKDI